MSMEKKMKKQKRREANQRKKGDPSNHFLDSMQLVSY
jgi:hypothetical protein